MIAFFGKNNHELAQPEKFPNSHEIPANLRKFGRFRANLGSSTTNVEIFIKKI
jgi:hypothetical protein